MSDECTVRRWNYAMTFAKVFAIALYSKIIVFQSDGTNSQSNRLVDPTYNGLNSAETIAGEGRRRA